MYWTVRIFWLVAASVFVAYKLVIHEGDWMHEAEWSTVVLKAIVICICVFFVLMFVPARFRVRAFASYMTLALYAPVFITLSSNVDPPWQEFYQTVHAEHPWIENLFPSLLIPQAREAGGYQYPPSGFGVLPSTFQMIILTCIPWWLTYMAERDEFESQRNVPKLRETIPDPSEQTPES